MFFTIGKEGVDNGCSLGSIGRARKQVIHAEEWYLLNQRPSIGRVFGFLRQRTGLKNILKTPAFPAKATSYLAALLVFHVLENIPILASRCITKQYGNMTTAAINLWFCHTLPVVVVIFNFVPIFSQCCPGTY